MNNDAKYTSYQNMVTQVNIGLVQMQKAAMKMRLEETAKNLEASKRKLERRRFSVGILGEFKRGKSTVINSLLEKEIMPADILPTSATMNRVTYDMQPHVELRMRDGSTLEINIDELPNYVTKLDEEKEAQAAKVEEAVVYYPCKFCQNGVDIVDTPGLNDDDRMSRITEEIIPQLDVVIMVLVPDNPLSISEADFMLHKLMTSDLGRLIFLVNKIDILRRESDRVRAVENIRERIQKKVLEKVEEQYGADSQEYGDARKKLGDIRIFPFSALDALDGKQMGDQSLIEKSGTIPFEQELTRMLTEERGAIELQIPMSVMGKAAQEILKAIAMRKNALEMSGKEFEEQQKKMFSGIEDIRSQKTEEKKKLRRRAVAVRDELTAQVTAYYPQLRAQLEEKLESCYIDPKTLETKGGQDAAVADLHKALSSVMQSSISAFSEKIEQQLRDIAGKEAARLGDFAQSVSGRLDTLREGIGNESAWKKEDWIGVGAEYALAMTIGGFGLGGIIEGYRAAGFKGAALGGAAGLAAQFATAIALTSIALPALPLSLIALAAGPLTSKFLVGKVFKADKGQRTLTKIRETMKKNLGDMISDLESRGELENWVKQRVSSVFEELSSTLEEECETMLKDTQKTMDAIKEDLLQNEMQRKKLMESYEESQQTVKQILENLKPVSDKIGRVLMGNSAEKGESYAEG